MSSSSQFSRIVAAAIDGRTQNIRYRQKQFHRLHSALLEHASDIKEAIHADSAITAAESEIEYLLTVSEVRKQYDTLSLEKDLEVEYRVAYGKDGLERRVGAGIVYIAPNISHSPFYSIISPLSAALAAGNCIVLELHNNLLEISSLLRQILIPALDADTFAVSDGKPDAEFLAKTVQVLQQYTEEPASSPRLISPSTFRSVVVVDRTANLDEAAKAVVQARFAFGGNSPYAPDAVLVNEFVIQPFLTAVVQYSSRYLAEQNGVANGKPQKPRGDSLTDSLDEAKKNGGIRVVVSGSNGTVVEILDRKCALLNKKINGKLLNVHSISSLDDAIDLANSTGSLAAAFAYGSPASAKYLTQFIDAQISFANQVPLELLVGPALQLFRWPSSLTSESCEHNIEE